MDLESEKKFFELVEMIAQTQRDLVSVINAQQNKNNSSDIAVLCERIGSMNQYMADHFRRFDLIYKFIIPLFLALSSLLLGGQVWKTAQVILAGKG